MTAVVGSALELAERIRPLVERRAVVVVGIAGFGGSGKSTLARALQPLLPAARVRGDDFLDPIGSREPSDDWAALHRDELAAVLDALRAARPAAYRPVDWATGGRSPERLAQPARVQLVDSVGLLHPALLPHLDLAVWVDVPLEVATARGMRRDRAAGNDHDALWRDVWAPTERAFEERYRPRERAAVRFRDPE